MDLLLQTWTITNQEVQQNEVTSILNHAETVLKKIKRNISQSAYDCRWSDVTYWHQHIVLTVTDSQ